MAQHGALNWSGIRKFRFMWSCIRLCTTSYKSGTLDRTCGDCSSPTCSNFQGPLVLILYFPRMDDMAVFQHVRDHMIPLHYVLFLTPHGRSKETMFIPFAEWLLLPAWLVLTDDLAEHTKSSILLQLHTPFSTIHL